MDERVGWLGTGVMGAPMARNVAAAGLDVTCWNRTADKAAPLAEHGLAVAGTAAEAASGRTLLVTVLADADAVLAALDDGAVLAELARDALWLQMSTVGDTGHDRLAALAEQHGVGFVDAPVLGTRQPAEQGRLVVLAAGPDQARERCRPVFDAVGDKTVWLGASGEASRLKLVLNAWLLGLLAALADAVRLAEALGVDPARFLDTIEGAPMGSPYARLKGDAMRSGEYPTAFSLRLAAKDAALVQAAADGAGARLGIADAVATLLDRGVAAGWGEDDMAAVVEVLRRA